MDYLLIIPLLVSFIVALISLPYWIKKCKSVNLLWKDMNKFGHPKNVASSGGIVVIMAFILGVLTYVALKTFIFQGVVNALEIFLRLPCKSFQPCPSHQ